MNQFTSIVSFIAALAFLANNVHSSYIRSPRTTCFSARDCPATHCCVLSFERFSLPKCALYGEEGSWCFTGQEQPENRTVHYPDGSSVDLEEVYTHFCPCSENLECIKNTCVSSNSISNEISTTKPAFFEDEIFLQN